jgi:hypothetical protein
MQTTSSQSDRLREQIPNKRFSEAQGEAKIGEWEGAHRATNALSKRGSLLLRNIYWDHTGFMKIHLKPSGKGNLVEYILQKYQLVFFSF